MGRLDHHNTSDTERDGDQPESGEAFPTDFSAEDARLASELKSLFAIEEEELPPFFVETVLENPWHEPVPSGYEHKVVYSVFRQLDLPRRTLVPPRRGFPGWRAVAGELDRVGRPLRGLVVAFFLLVVLSLGLAGPSFASGLRFLLVHHTGVQQVHQYPMANQVDSYDSSNVISRSEFHAVSRPVFWVGPSIYGYEYQGIWLLGTERWSSGPVVDVHYARHTPTGGTGTFDLREFQISPQYAAVLQVVENGSVSAEFSGSTASVYVDGQWVATKGKGDTTTQWVRGGRSELILEEGNTIIWITADQHDGMGAPQLLGISEALTAMLTNSPALGTPSAATTASLAQQFVNETYLLVPQGTSPDDSTTYTSIKGHPAPVPASPASSSSVAGASGASASTGTP